MEEEAKSQGVKWGGSPWFWVGSRAKQCQLFWDSGILAEAWEQVYVKRFQSLDPGEQVRKEKRLERSKPERKVCVLRLAELEEVICIHAPRMSWGMEGLQFLTEK